MVLMSFCFCYWTERKGLNRLFNSGRFIFPIPKQHAPPCVKGIPQGCILRGVGGVSYCIF